MPNWKKVIISGSNATLNSLDVSTNITASGNISSSNEVSAKFLELPFSSDAGGASLYFNDGTFVPNDDVPYIRGERQSGTVGYLALGYNDSDMLTVGKNSNGNSVDIPGSLKVGTDLTASNAQINGSLFVTGSSVAQIQPVTIEEFDYNGDVLGTQVAGEDLSQGHVCIMRSNGKWYKADATNTSLSTTISGIALNTAVASATVDILTRGLIGTNSNRLTSVSSGPGSPIYLATIGGTMSQTAPSSSGNVVRIIGHYLRLVSGQTTKYVISFNPDGIWLEL